MIELCESCRARRPVMTGTSMFPPVGITPQTPAPDAEAHRKEYKRDGPKLHGDAKLSCRIAYWRETGRSRVDGWTSDGPIGVTREGRDVCRNDTASPSSGVPHSNGQE